MCLIWKRDSFPHLHVPRLEHGIAPDREFAEPHVAIHNDVAFAVLARPDGRRCIENNLLARGFVSNDSRNAREPMTISRGLRKRRAAQEAVFGASGQGKQRGPRAAVLVF